MVVLTRTQKATADFKHVINVIMNQPDGSPITQALDSLGVVDTLAMIGLEKQQIESMIINRSLLAVSSMTPGTLTVGVRQPIVSRRLAGWVWLH